MNSLSSQPIKASRFFSLFLVIIILSSALIFPYQTAQAQSDQLFWQDSFRQYGFEVKGFSSEQEEIIEGTLQAYAQALGGARKLREIIKTYNHGENWTITYAPNATGADSSIMLSPTVFSMEKALAANYSSYAANNETAHAQIVIGHEISHLLIRAVKARSGINWSKSYEQRVRRDWASIQNVKASEEEAVTELSLNILQMGYYFSINADNPETNPGMVAEIDGWVADFLAALQDMK